MSTDANSRAIEDVIKQLDELIERLDNIFQQPKNDETLLDVDEVAARLQVSPSKVSDIAEKEGGLEMVWVGDKRRFTRDAVEAFIESGGKFSDGWNW